jgi:hypothetical protein
MFNRILIGIFLISLNCFSDCMPKTDDEIYSSADFIVEGVYSKTENNFHIKKSYKGSFKEGEKVRIDIGDGGLIGVYAFDGKLHLISGYEKRANNCLFSME